MVKAMKRRDVIKAFRVNGIEFKREGKGDHEVWECTCGKHHTTVVTQTNEISPGVIRQIMKQITCRPKGWLQ